MAWRPLRLGADAPYRSLVGVGGVGRGIFFDLEGGHDLGRNESRPGRLLPVRDYCKLHIIAHYPAVLLEAGPPGSAFRVVPIARVGDDEAGRDLRREMEGVGMDCRFVLPAPGRPTLQSVCFQYPDGSGGNITTSDSAAETLTTADVDAAADLIDRSTIVLAAPEAPLAARVHLLRLGTERGALRAAAFTSAEAAEARRLSLFAHADIVAFNEDEAQALTGIRYDPDDARPLLGACASTLGAESPGVRILFTAGANGAYGFDGASWKHCPALPVSVASTAGAGDALLAGVLTALAAGAPFAEALEFGALLAAYKVTSPHTIHPDAGLDRLVAFASEQGKELHAL
ncbi:MAG TPA: carbohydrate kinase family protein [Vicinamibacteria bacterium]|nr:carbohydrate kinase family protein [Vicinamibacteria bacterium]